MVCVPAVEGDSFVNILSVMMNSSVNRLKRWEDNKWEFYIVVWPSVGLSLAEKWNDCC